MYRIEENKWTLTNITIAITVVMYIIQTSMHYGSLYLGLNIYFIEGGLYWQPLSTMFAHGGIAHLGMNMFVLYQFGNPIERFRGKKEFILVYFVAGILTSLLSFGYIYYLNNSANLVGASGAICALMGYYAYFDKHQRKGIITWILLISVVPVLLGLPIAWYSHFIGLALGFLIAVLRK
jgi:rhomboid protease GluP